MDGNGGRNGNGVSMELGSSGMLDVRLYVYPDSQE